MNRTTLLLKSIRAKARNLIQFRCSLESYVFSYQIYGLKAVKIVSFQCAKVSVLEVGEVEELLMKGCEYL